jgi:site-specific DNA-cytosine methylase
MPKNLHPISERYLLMQAGNAMIVYVIYELGKQILKSLEG